VSIQQDHHQRFGYPAALQDSPSVASLDFPPGLKIMERLAHLRQLGDPRHLITGWISLCARLVGLGWVGPAYGAENLGLNGGILQTDELTHLDTRSSLAEARVAIEASLESLTQGVSAFLIGNPYVVPLRGPTPAYAVRLEFHEHCRQQIEQGHLLPPPLAQAVVARPAFDRLVDELRQ